MVWIAHNINGDFCINDLPEKYRYLAECSPGYAIEATSLSDCPIMFSNTGEYRAPR